jgi:hypothetical protein
MLIDEVAGLRRQDLEDEEQSASRERDDRLLLKARRRAVAVVMLDWAAILVLLLLRNWNQIFLVFGPTEEAVFTLGVLAVAVHSGFRLGQWEKYRRVTALVEELADRSPER